MKFFLLALCVFSHPALSESLDEKVLTEALGQTKSILNDPSKRQDVIAADPKAKAADDQLQSLTQSPELTAKTYQLAGQIMETLVKSHAGDVEGMMKELEKAARDPAAF